jgi:hypothetical protein
MILPHDMHTFSSSNNTYIIIFHITSKSVKIYISEVTTMLSKNAKEYRSIHVLNVSEIFKASTHSVHEEEEYNLLVVYLIIAVQSTIIYACTSVLLHEAFPLILHSPCSSLQDQKTTLVCLS